RAIFALHAGEDFLLTQRDPELFVGLQNFRIDFIERFRSNLLFRRGVVMNVLVIDLVVAHACPSRLAHWEPATVGVEPPFQHPSGLVFLGRNKPDDVLRETLWRLLGFDIGYESIFILIDVDAADPLDRLLHGRHSFPPLTVSRTAGWNSF